jgi:hypothetical protein
VTDKDEDSDEESQGAPASSEASPSGSGPSGKPQVEAAAAPVSASLVAAAVALAGKRIVMCGTTLETLNGARGKCESVNETTGACKVKLDVPRLAQVTLASSARISLNCCSQRRPLRIFFFYAALSDLSHASAFVRPVP